MKTQLAQQEQEYKETELGQLPKDWDVVKLGEVADIFDKKRVPLSEDVRAKRKGIYPYCGANGIIDYINEFIFDGEFVLLAEDGGYWGSGENSAYIMNGKFWVNNHAHILKAISGKTINKFLFYSLNHIDMNPLIGGDARGKLTQTIMRTIQLPFPSLPEQQQIAFVLSTIQEAGEKTENVINSLKELKKSLMKHLFTYGAVSFEDAEKVKLKGTEIGEVPEEWEVVKVSNVFEISGKPKNLKILEKDKIIFIAMEDISETKKQVNYKLKEFSKISSGVFVLKDDLIISKITPCFENGKQAILTNIPQSFAIATTEVIPLHPKKDKQVLTDHLYNYLKIADVRQKLITKMEGTTGRKRLSKNVLNTFLIPLPTLPIQQQIASILSAVDEKIEAEENKKKTLDELFKSMLHNLMTAKIRVNNLVIEDDRI